MATTINSVKRILLGKPVRFRISQARCENTITAFQENRWPTDRTGKIKETATAPLNDVHNDGMRATAYYMVETFPPPTIDEALSQAIMGGERISQIGRTGDRDGRIDPGISGDMKF